MKQFLRISVGYFARSIFTQALSNCLQTDVNNSCLESYNFIAEVNELRRRQRMQSRTEKVSVTLSTVTIKHSKVGAPKQRWEGGKEGRKDRY